MLLSELAGRVAGARRLGSQDPEITDLAYDSRRVGPGTLFMALPGERVDGAQFVDAAAGAGAVAVLA